MLAVSAWLFLPWLEILTRVRRLRLPLDKRLRSALPPSLDRFPQLPDLTSEIEAEGFESVEDTVFEWSGARQFMRLFYHGEEKQQAAISLLEHENIAMAWVSLSARTNGGRVWTTWNYPFSYTMKLPPEATLNVAMHAAGFAELFEAHRAFLLRNGLGIEALTEQDPENFVVKLQEDTRRQVDHNLDQGLIRLIGDGTFRYSWRGYLFFVAPISKRHGPAFVIRPCGSSEFLHFSRFWWPALRWRQDFRLSAGTESPGIFP